MAENHPVFQFGPFILDVGRRQLRRGSDTVKLYPKEFDTLVALVERSGEVVEKEELLQRVWRDAAVEEGNLTTHVSHLRKVLGGASSNRDYIATIPGRGYEFVAVVTRASGVVTAPRGPQAAVRRSRAILLVVALTAIAVAAAAAMLMRRNARETVPGFHQLTFRRGTIWSARFSPDGQTIVYGAAWDGRPIELFSTRPGSPESRTLGQRADVLSISPSGEMAVSLDRRFLRTWESSGTLARLSLGGGAPRELLTDIKDAEWSADGKDLIIVRRSGDRDRLEFPQSRVIYEVQGFIMSPRVSRPTNAIALLQRRSGDESVELITPEGSHHTLAAGLSGTTGLSWSAGGREVLFSLVRSGSTEIHRVTLSGKRTLLTQTPGEWQLNDVAPDGRMLMTQHYKRGHTVGMGPGDGVERDLSWLDRSAAVGLSSDGHVLLLAEVGAGGGEGNTVYIRRMDGSPAVRLGDGKAAALSPDGKWVIANQGSAPEQLVQLPTGPGVARVLPKGPLTDYFRVQWLADNEHIVFGAIEPEQPLRRYIQNVREGLPRLLARPAEGPGAVFLADGSTYVARGRGREHYIYGFVDDGPRRVPNVSADEHIIQASDDGRILFVLAVDGMTLRIDRLEPATGHRALVKQLVIADPAGVMYAGPEYPPALITPDGRTYVYNYLRVLSNLYLVDRLR